MVLQEETTVWVGLWKMKVCFPSECGPVTAECPKMEINNYSPLPTFCESATSFENNVVFSKVGLPSLCIIYLI